MIHQEEKTRPGRVAHLVGVSCATLSGTRETSARLTRGGTWTVHFICLFALSKTQISRLVFRRRGGAIWGRGWWTDSVGSAWARQILSPKLTSRTTLGKELGPSQRSLFIRQKPNVHFSELPWQGGWPQASSRRPWGGWLVADVVSDIELLASLSSGRFAQLDSELVSVYVSLFCELREIYG